MLLCCACCLRLCSFEKRHKTLSAHVSPAFRVKEGDVVTVGQCRYASTPSLLLHDVCALSCLQHVASVGLALAWRLVFPHPYPSLPLLFVCRSPLSKTVRFNVLKVEEATEAGALAAKKAFRVF